MPQYAIAFGTSLPQGYVKTIVKTSPYSYTLTEDTTQELVYNDATAGKADVKFCNDNFDPIQQRFHLVPKP